MTTAGWSKPARNTTGLLLFALAGQGTLLETQLSAGTVDATAYAVRTASGGLNLSGGEQRHSLQNMILTIETNQNIELATLQTMTGASLAATPGYDPGRRR